MGGVCGSRHNELKFYRTKIQNNLTFQTLYSSKKTIFAQSYYLKLDFMEKTNNTEQFMVGIGEALVDIFKSDLNRRVGGGSTDICLSWRENVWKRSYC